MITLALIVSLIGLLIYLLVDPELRKGRVVETGKWAYIIGLATYLIALGGKAVL